MSVSVFGQDDVDIEVALDEVFKSLQQSLNRAHSSTRELVMVGEQDAEYMTALEIQQNLVAYVDDFKLLMKELVSVSKQLLGPCPASEKTKAKAYLDRRKVEREREKEEELARRVASMGITGSVEKN
jgi:hypothetical protein